MSVHSFKTDFPLSLISLHLPPGSLSSIMSFYTLHTLCSEGSFWKNIILYLNLGHLHCFANLLTACKFFMRTGAQASQTFDQ